MKKLIALLTLMTLTLSLAGCNGANQGTEDTVTAETTTEYEGPGVQEEAPEAEKTETDQEANAQLETEAELANQGVTEADLEEQEDTEVDHEADTESDAVIESGNQLESNSFEAIIAQTYEVFGQELPRTGTMPLEKEMQAYFLGTDSFDYTEGLVSEPMMGSVAHSIVLFTVEEGADVEAIKEAVRSNVDPRKWICVGVEPEQVIVENFDNMIVLIMEERSADLFAAMETVINKAQ